MLVKTIRPFSDTQKKKLILSGFIFLMLVHVIFTFAGFYDNDDINYARYAAGVMHNGVSCATVKSHFQLRWATIYSTAVFYSLFGITAFTSALTAVISFSLCGILLYKILRQNNMAVYFLSLLFFFFAYSTVFYMHRLLPDPAISLAVLWMYYSYRSYYLSSQYPVAKALQFAAALFLAIITKETILIVLPLFLFFFIRDMVKKKRLLFWKYAVTAAIIFVGLYLVYFKITTGDFFYRYHLLINTNAHSAFSFDKIPATYPFERIGYRLWRAMLLNGDMLVYLPAVAAIIYTKKINSVNIERIDTFSFFILLCCADLMTISFSHYVPPPADPRHFIFLLPLAAILGGSMVYAYLKDPAKFLLLPVFLLVATAIMFWMNAGNTKYLYLLFSLLLTGRYIFVSSTKKHFIFKLSLTGIGLLFSLNYVINFVRPVYPFYWGHKKLIHQVFEDKNITATVFCADAFSAEMSEFFMQFKTGNIKFISIDSLNTNTNAELYYLVNANKSSTDKIKMDSIIAKNSASGVFLADTESTIFLYRVNNTVLNIMRGKY